MPEFFAPVSYLYPPDDLDVRHGRFGLVKREWDVSVFDWAEIEAHHNSTIPFTIADHLLKQCNLELVVECGDIEEAAEFLLPLHLMLYTNGVHPFAAQIVATHSVNDYGGLSWRKTRRAFEAQPPEHRRGVVSNEVAIEVRRVDYPSGYHVRTPNLRRQLTRDLFMKSAEDAVRWVELRQDAPELVLLERVALTAPVIPAVDQSMLHVWTGLESLFPRVQTEVSFRLAMYLAQLSQRLRPRRETFDLARRSYGDRSKVAHGRSGKNLDLAEWERAWSLLMQSLRGVIDRGEVPKEEALIGELLDDIL